MCFHVHIKCHSIVLFGTQKEIFFFSFFFSFQKSYKFIRNFHLVKQHSCEIVIDFSGKNIILAIHTKQVTAFHHFTVKIPFTDQLQNAGELFDATNQKMNQHTLTTSQCSQCLQKLKVREVALGRSLSFSFKVSFKGFCIHYSC